LIAFAGSIFTILAYQRSFYPPEAPGYPGISAETPFICGEVPPAKQVYRGPEVFQNLLDLVEANPNKGTIEFAFLALGTQKQAWAEDFRESLMAEAEAGLFTQPAGSVKYGQYLASKRAYFYPLVRTAFPNLFTPEQNDLITQWFADINRRTLTVELVDWFYALAFRFWPQGPYENQENGAGLLALLELNGLAAPELSNENQSYLEENPRGWFSRFRVTDDAAPYQPEWMANAWFQALYTQEVNQTNQEYSFEWLKMMALPDGSPLRYNHLGHIEYASRSYWGAKLLDDEELLWLAGRGLNHLMENPQWAHAQPGTETPAYQTGISPSIGSCLIYGNSGLPTQEGPLAPDKIVFRSGWEQDDLYFALNLRFTGWHRYKATNTIMHIYQKEPLLIENTAGENFDWLPIGRSIFRDKRIPRENLNGLQIQKTGLAAVLYKLTGIGSQWAQDPPFYAEVTHFETSPEVTRSSTQITDWHGWDHQRSISFYPEGVAVVIDEVQGPAGKPTTLTWSFVSEDEFNHNQRIKLGRASEDHSKPEIVPFILNNGQINFRSDISIDGLPLLKMDYHHPNDGNIKTLTVFLFNEWIGAQIQIDQSVLEIKQGKNQIDIFLEHEK
jgi:hypothetical protein